MNNMMFIKKKISNLIDYIIIIEILLKVIDFIRHYLLLNLTRL
jgi:hypothetical protein